MNPITRNILAVIAGVFVGGTINYGILMLGGSIIPWPEGVDPAVPETIKANIDQFETKNWIIPFLAHALGTLAGAFVTAKIAVIKKRTFALVIGVFFLAGGIANIMSLHPPFAFSAIDLALAYIPMAWIGAKLAGNKNEYRV